MIRDDEGREEIKNVNDVPNKDREERTWMRLFRYIHFKYLFKQDLVPWTIHTTGLAVFSSLVRLSISVPVST